MPKDDGLKVYVLKPGKEHHLADGTIIRGGEPGNDRTELSADAAKAFADKFESVEDMNERLKLQDELKSTKNQQAKIVKALEAKGISLEELLSEAEPKSETDEGSGGGDDKKSAAPTTPPTTNKVEPPKTTK